MTTIFSPDSLRASVEAASGGHNTVIYDDKGYPSYMVRIPKFRYEDLGMDSEFGTGVVTAFLKGGEELSEILIGQYQASVYDGRACSLPGKDPATGIDFDDSRAACENKGPGWHMMNRHEWAAIALWCMANGFEPRGNTDYGRAHDAHHEIGVKTDGTSSPGVDSSGQNRTYTGSGPASWRHNNGIAGIADLVGNVREWTDQLKIDDGRIICTEDNQFDADESSWTKQDSYFSNESGSPQLQNEAGTVNDEGIGTTWANVYNARGYSESQLLQRLLVSPAGIEPQGSLYLCTEGERMPRCGGAWRSGSNAGLANLRLDYSRGITHSGTGFRPAFVS